MNNQIQTIIDRARALLAMADWYAYDPKNGTEWHGTQADAKADALAALDNFRDASPDGWHEDVGSVQWGVLIPFEQAEEIDRVETPDAEFDYLCDYAMKPHELGDALMTVIDGAATLCDALKSAERRAEEAEAQAHEIRAVVQRVGDCIEEWGDAGFIVVSHEDEPMPSIRRVVDGVDAGRALLDRLHAAETERDVLQTEVARLRSDVDIERAQSRSFVQEIERLRVVEAGAAVLRHLLNNVGRSVEWSRQVRECLHESAGVQYLDQFRSVELDLADSMAKVAELQGDIAALQRDLSSAEKECRMLRAEVERNGGCCISGAVIVGQAGEEGQ